MKKCEKEIKRKFKCLLYDLTINGKQIWHISINYNSWRWLNTFGLWSIKQVGKSSIMVDTIGTNTPTNTKTRDMKYLLKQLTFTVIYWVLFEANYNWYTNDIFLDESIYHYTSNGSIVIGNVVIFLHAISFPGNLNHWYSSTAKIWQNVKPLFPLPYSLTIWL